jgi:tetratricopeptide (TPR) repeat protein
MLMLLGSAAAGPVDEWFVTANRFYEQKHYDSAAVYYQKTIDAGVVNSAVYFNLGNCFYRLNKLGYAILNYEKARELAPRDEDILTNIRFANLNIADRVPEPPRTLLDSFFWRLHTLMPLGVQLWVLIGLLTLLSLLFALGLFSSRNVRLWIIYSSVLLLLAVAGIGLSAGIKVYQLEKISYAVVLSRSLDARNEPQGSKVLFSIHEGTKVRILRRMQEWSLVSLPNGVSGWVENRTLGAI